MPDYREQYVNNNQTTNSNEKRPLTLEHSLVSMPTPDLNQNSMNVTKTTFVSPSMRSLVTDNIQFTRDYPLKTAKPMNHRSVLVRAYYNQENQKAILQEKLSSESQI